MTNSVADGYFTVDAYNIDAVAARHQPWLQVKSKSMEHGIYAIGLLQVCSARSNTDVEMWAMRHYGIMLSGLHMKWRYLRRVGRQLWLVRCMLCSAR